MPPSRGISPYDCAICGCRMSFLYPERSISTARKQAPKGTGHFNMSEGTIMRSRFYFSLLFGASVIVALCSSLSSESRADESWQVAYLGEPATKLAQQAEPAAPAAPPAQAPAENKGPGWAVNCKSAATETGLECRLSQTVVTQQGGQVLADVTVLIPADKKAPEAILRLPLGILLPAGATLRVDDKVALQLNFRACDRNGCYARAPISATMLADLQKGRQLHVNFKNLAEKPIDVPLSLDGFAEAYAKI